MVNRPKNQRRSFHRIADRLTVIRLGVHAVRRRLRRGESPDSAAVTAQLARIDQEVAEAAAALANLDPDHDRPEAPSGR